ncbi:hypothetical protein [Streptosporangium sp. CA-115845]|uniref:hypothetical protein n=1 Tax=Streptosporangium sp. CA-115845 TaxID=3240071 RepID=UPI003D8B18A6
MAERVLAGRYRLTGQLGRTGVWRARDELLGRDVAVKEVRCAPGDHREAEGPAVRFATGQDLAAEFVVANEAVRRRSVVLTAVHDLVVEDDASWLVMRLDTGGRRRRALAVAAVCVTAAAVTAAVLVVVGSRTSPVTALPRACDLLTPQEAEALIPQAKVSVTAPPTPGPNVSDCGFSTGDKALHSGQRPALIISVRWHGDGADKAVTDFTDRWKSAQSLRQTLFPGAPEGRHLASVPDLGDEAFFLGGVSLGSDKRRVLDSAVLYRLGNVVVLMSYSRQNVTQEADAQAVGPLKELVIKAARRTVEALER